MAGILSRFKTIMEANINALLDKAEDPVKMADQLARDLEKDLGEVKAETVSVMAEEKRAKRAYDEGVAEVEKLQRYAEKAVLAGNDADAKVFLSEKAAKAANLESLKGAWDLAAANAAKMREMHDKLTDQLKQVEDRKAAIRAKAAMVKSQQKANEIKSDLGGSSLAAFDALEEKLNRKLDEAEAAAELNTKKDDMAAYLHMLAKYDDAATVQDSGVEDELAALKAKLGK
jgi:phage shock protein A